MAMIDDCHIQTALAAAARSPCRSKRGVALYDPSTGAHRGSGHNGPPGGSCPGRAVCAGTCGQRSVHAEVRALRDAMRVWIPNHGGGERGALDLVHVELEPPFVDIVAPDPRVVVCSGPSCPGCAAQILDVGFVGGVWLYEMGTPPDELAEAARRGIAVLMRPFWRRYSAQEFYRVTLERCGMAR